MSPYALLSRHGGEDLVALPATEGGRAWDRRSFLRAARAVMDRLPAAGSKEAEGKEQVVLICRDRLRFAAGLLAAWERGYRVALPPNPQPQTVRALRAMPSVLTVLHDVGGDDVWGDGEGEPGLVRGLDLGEMEISEEEPGELRPIEADRELVIVYTSGSTGPHLACPKTAGQLLGEAELLARTFGIGPGDRILATVPPHHIYGLLFGVLLPLCAGAAFVRETRLHAAAVAAQARAAAASVLVSVPAHLRGLRVLPVESSSAEPAGAEEAPFPPLSRIFSSGAPLPPPTARFLKERLGWTVTEVFGSTETGGVAHRESGGEGPWTLFEGLSYDSREDEQLALRSPFIHPSVPLPFVAADRVRGLDERRFLHLGRSDGVVKVGGLRVSLAEVEQLMLGIEGVRDAAAVAVEVGGARGQVIWAAYVSETLEPKEVRAALLRWLSPVALPRRLRRLPRLPRTEHGKLPRAALLGLFGGPTQPKEGP